MIVFTFSLVLALKITITTQKHITTVPLVKKVHGNFMKHIRNNHILLQWDMMPLQGNFLPKDGGYTSLHEEVLPGRLVTFSTEIYVEKEGTFRIMFDTGSSESWILWKSDDEIMSKHGHLKSERYEKCKPDCEEPCSIGSEMNIQYISGAITGPVIRCSIQLGNMKIIYQKLSKFSLCL